jgi:Uma2 family endonuclease
MSPDRGGTLGFMAVMTDAQEPLHLLSVDEYHRMIEVGILTDEDKVELLDGAIFEMSPEGPPHALVIARLARFVIAALLDDPSLLVRVGSPVTLRPRSEPEPDIAVVDTADATWRAHPQRAHLLIEVAHSSLRKDRTRKARIYATAGVPEYWVVDLGGLCVHVHRAPSAERYVTVETVRPPQALKAQALELPPLALDELLSES